MHVLVIALASLAALALLAGAVAYKDARESWPPAALRHTWRGALAAWLAAVGLGAAIAHWLPAAQSLPHAVRLWLG